jgi:hypothetical protein
MRPYLEKSFTKIGLVEWLKVKALSSSPSTTKKKNPNNKNQMVVTVVLFLDLLFYSITICFCYSAFITKQEYSLPY